MYIVELLIKISFKNIVWSISLNLFIFLGSSRCRFRAMVGMIECCQKRVACFHVTQSTGPSGLPLVFRRIVTPSGLMQEDLFYYIIILSLCPIVGFIKIRLIKIPYFILQSRLRVLISTQCRDTCNLGHNFH